jgi:conjugal transfer pilin signal peptidase TrbI
VVLANGLLALNGEPVGDLNPGLLAKLEMPVSQFDRNEQVQGQELWAMGTAEDSFDSRYWGFVQPGQVVGQVYPLY